MKLFLFTMCCFMLAHHSKAQEFQLINYNHQPSPDRSVLFYKSLPDTSVEASLKMEFQSLSDFFMVTANCIYYDTSRVSYNDMMMPDSLSNPVFLNIRSVNFQSGVIGASIIDKLVHQFGVIVIKKYKLDIPTEFKVILTDYLAGYYMACRNRASENKFSLKINNLDEVHEFDLVSDKIRQSAYVQGEIDSNNNYLKRKVFTLNDLLRSGLAYVEASL